MSLSASLNIPAIILFSIYLLLSCYLLILILQRITYTLKSPLPLILMRFILFLMVLIGGILCNILYLYSCFVDTNTATSNPYYKYPFYIQFYFNNICWSSSVIFMAYCIKFKRHKPQRPSIHNQLSAYDVPTPETVDIPKQKLNIADVDLDINPYQNHLKLDENKEDLQHNPNQLSFVNVESKSSTKTKTFSWKPPQTVFDNNKQHQNQGFFIFDLYVIGIGSLLFNIIWYAVHEQYIDSFIYTEQHLMPRWYFPYNHKEHTTLIIINRGFLSVWLIIQAIYLYKEFYNYLVIWCLIIALIIYWFCFGFLITNTIHDDGDGFQFIAPLLYYVIFFSLHVSDAQRDEQPMSQSVFVNEDILEMFYRLWRAKRYRSKLKIAPNMFCFGPLPHIEIPTKASIILLGGWGNIKEDYDRIAYLLSQYQRNVIVIDYRGVGETDLYGVSLPDNHQAYTTEQYAEDVFDLIKQLFPYYEQHVQHDDIDDEYSDDSKDDYDSNDEFQKKNHKKNQHKVYLLGLSMGANVALQCALHPDANRYLQGIVLCSAWDNVWEKPKDFDNFANQMLTGNALHYGWCEAQKKYIRCAHSESYLASWWNRTGLRTFYSWRMSTHPYYCCNFSNDIKNERDRETKRSGRGPAPSLDRDRGISKWFSNVGISLRIMGGDKHRVVRGIERQSDIAEEGIDISRILQHLQMPSFIYSGTNDTMIHPNSADLLRRKLGPNACRDEFEEGGHNFWFENPSMFVKTVGDWINNEEDLYVANN